MTSFIRHSSALISLSLAALLSAPVAHAGMFDLINQATQIASAVKGAAPAPQPVQAPAPAAAAVVDPQAMQVYATMDCKALKGLEMTYQQQLAASAGQAAPATQVSKAAGLLSKAGGLLGAFGGGVGLNANAIQQASEMASSASQIAGGAAQSQAPNAAAQDMTQQLAAVRVMLQAKTCQ